MLYVPLDFENNLTVDAMVDSGAFVSAIAQDDLDTIKRKAPKNILTIDDPPNFQKQVANGQLEKSLSTATLKFVIGDNTFAEHFVVMKKLTEPIIGLHFMRKNSVVIDTTHGLKHFPYLTMQVKTVSSETSTKVQPVITDEALTTNDDKNNPSLHWPSGGMEHNRHCDIVGEVYGNSKFADFPFNVDNNRQESSSQSNQYNGITLSHTKKHTQIAEFSVVTPEQSKHIKPVDKAVLSMIPQSDPDLTAYLNEILRTNKPKQTRLSGSQHLKILESLRITPQYRRESSMNWTN